MITLGEKSWGVKGKVCIVTGSNSGIGKETALGLAGLGARVVMICRDAGRGESAKEEIVEKTGNRLVDLLIVDLSSQTSIRRSISDFRKRYDNLHVLINNAAVLLGKRSVTEDGIETTFAVNHLSYFLLTNLLVDILKDSAPSRVVNVSSSAHFSGTIRFDDLLSERKYGAWSAYSQSKLANILYTYELASRLHSAEVTVNCLHPGTVATNLERRAPIVFRLLWKASKPFLLTARQGAETSIYLASSPEVDGITGNYYVKRKKALSSRESYSESERKKLWARSEEMTRPRPP